VGRDGFVFFFFLLHCKPAYSEPVSGPEIGTVAAGRAPGIKIPLAAWLGLLSLSSVWLLVVTQ